MPRKLHRWLKRLRVLPRLKRAVLPILNKVVTFVRYLLLRWLPLRLYQFSEWLQVPVKFPKKLPRWFWIFVGLAVASILATLFAPRPIAHSYYNQFRALPKPPAVEAFEIEEEGVPRTSGYYYGYCTYGVSLQIDVPQDWGNAETWDDRAREDGWDVDRTPEIGGVAQDEYGSEGNGHVAVIIDIQGKEILVREMNFEGWNIMSERWTVSSDWDWFISR